MDESLEFGLPGLNERRNILSQYVNQYIVKAGTVEGGAGSARETGLWRRFLVSNNAVLYALQLTLFVICCSFVDYFHSAIFKMLGLLAVQTLMAAWVICMFNKACMQWSGLRRLLWIVCLSCSDS